MSCPFWDDIPKEKQGIKKKIQDLFEGNKRFHDE
jgi:hypothetical protein